MEESLRVSDIPPVQLFKVSLQNSAAMFAGGLRPLSLEKLLALTTAITAFCAAFLH